MSVIPTDASHAESISVPDAELLFRGQFHRAGPDLVLTGHDGRHHLIPGYFAGEKHPALVAPNGARLSPDLVDLLAGSPTPGEYAQAQPTTPPDAIGKVEKVVGDVTVMRNGVAVALHVGDAVYKSDVIQTGANSSVGIGFPDGTALNLVPNTRMALNEYSYDPNGTSNGALFSLVEGTFAFVAGKVAHTGGMNIETPVATMGIRGTTGFVEQVATITATVGNVTYSFAVVDDPGSTGHGQYDLIDANGNIIATVSQTGTVTYVTPQGPGAQPLVQVQAMTAAQVAFEQAIIQQVFQTLNLLNNPSQNSQPTPGTPGSSTPPGELNNLQHLLQENGGNPFTINIPVPGPTGPANVSGTVTITTNTPTVTGQPSSATIAWQSALNGTWETGSDWTGGGAPGTSQGAEIDLPVKVTIDEAEAVASLIIGASATLNIISNGALTVSNGISNSGLIEINSSGSDPTLAINGTVYLLDSGKIEMLGATAENLITGVPGSGATLVNVNNTIIGSGTIGQGDGALTLVNGSAGLIEAKPLLATDSGILVIDTGNTVSNSGVLEAAAGGTLQIDDPVNNLGTILADGGTVNISNTINNAGGTIEAIGANALVELADATIQGGTLTTSGSGASGSNINVVVATGANMSVLDGASEGSLTVDGYLGVFQGAQLELQGTIHIDGANGEIDVGGPTNGPTAQPTNLVIDGTVTIDTDGLNTTSASISLDGSASNTVQIIAASSGGTLDNVNTMIAGAGNIGAGDPSFLLINEASGVINASGTTALVIDNDSPATDNFAINEIVNSGTIEATGSGGLTIENTTIDNSTFNPSDNSGVDGHIEVFAGSQINLDNATILQGFVSTAAGGEIATVSGSSNEIETANGSTHNTNVATIINAGTIAVSDNSSLALASPYNIENSGTIELNSTGDKTILYFNQPYPILSGGGDIILEGGSGSQDIIAGMTGQGFTTVHLENQNDTISGAGAIGQNDGALTLQNDADGIINANLNGQTLTVEPGGAVTNDGLMEATNGGILAIDPTTVTNTSTIEATADSFVMIEGDTVTNYAVAGDITVNGTIEAVGTDAIVALFGATIVGGILETSDGGTIGVTSGINTFESVAVTGGSFIQTNDGATVDLQGTTTLGGTVTFEGGGTFTLDGDGAEIVGAADTNATLDNLGLITGAGQIGTGDDLLTLVNGCGDGVNTINADVDGKALTINTGTNAIINNGLLEATRGGELGIKSALINSNEVFASSHSEVAIDAYVHNISGAEIVARGHDAQVDFSVDRVRNDATIEATHHGTVSFDDATIANGACGTIEATHHGAITFDDSCVDNCGTIAAYGNGSVVELSDTAISGGTLATSWDGLIETVCGNSTFDDVTIACGSNVLVNDGTSLTLQGTIDNDGTITLAPAAYDPSLVIDGVVCLQGTGSVVLSDSSDNIVGACGDGCNVLINSEDISGAGQIGNWSSELTLINTSCGTIDANSSGGTLTLDTGCNTIINAGTLEANGGMLDVNSNVSGCGDVVITGGGIADFQDAFDQNVTFTGAGTLGLAQCYGGTVSGFSTGDALDLTNLTYSSCDHVVWTPSAVSSGGEGSGTLAIYNGETLEESIRLDGYYAQDNFAVTDDAGKAEVMFHPGSGLVGEIISPLTYVIGDGSVTDAIGQTPDATFVATDINYNMVPSGQGDIAQFLNAAGQNDANSITNLTATNVATNSPFSSYYQLDGYIELTGGVAYTFRLNSDDGSVLSIDGNPLINDDGEHAVVSPLSDDTHTYTFTPPTTGSYAIAIDYFANDYGTSQLLAQYEAGDSGFVDLTSAELFQQPLTPVTVAAGQSSTVSVPASDYVTFAGATGTLVLDQPETFVGQIAGFTGTAPDAAHSDVIDLVGFCAADTTVSASSSADGLTTLTVTDSSGDGLSATLTLVGTYSTSNFVVASDGHGGADILDPPANSSGAPVSIGGPGNDNFIFHPSLGTNAGNSNGPDDAAELERLSAAQAQHWSPLIGNDAHNDAIEFVHHSDGTMPPDSNAAYWHLAMHNAVNLH